MNLIHAFILRISTWYVWLIFFLSYSVFAGYVMNNAGQTMKTVCGEQVRVPDIEIGYTAAQLREMIDFMSPECRAEYHFIATVTDSVYPFAYGLFFFFSIVILYYKTKVPAPKFKLYVFPLFAILFDFLENASIDRLLAMEHHPDYMYQMASGFSLAKWFFAFASIVLIVLGIVRWLLVRFKKPQTT